MRRTHKWELDSEKYRSFVKPRNDKKVSSVNPNTKRTYREDVTKTWNEVRVWLQTPSGGGHSTDESRIVAYKIRQILEDLPHDIIEKILEDDYWKQLENWFVNYSSTKQANSARAYLFAFKNYLSYVIFKKLFNFTSTKLIEVESRLKKLITFLNKRTAQQKSDKLTIPISYEDVRNFESSEYFSRTKALIERIDCRNFPIRDIDIREFIAINLLLNNGCRPCVIANMTEAEYLNGDRIEAEECVIVLVANHKQIFQGKARLSIPFWLHDIIEIYRQYIRPENLNDYEFAGRQVTPCIATGTGTRYTTTSLLSDIKACWAKAGMTAQIMSMYIRKLAVTGVHEFGSEEDKDRAALHQAHSKSTAATYYRQKHLSEQAAIDSKVVRLGITGELQNKYSSNSYSIHQEPVPQCSKTDPPPNSLISFENGDTNSDTNFNPLEENSSESDSDFEPSPKRKKNCQKNVPMTPTEITYKRNFKIVQRKRGQSFFNESERQAIETAFYPYIHGVKPKPGVRVAPPKMAMVKTIIETNNLESKLRGKCNPLKILGCIKGILNKIYGYK